MVDINAIQVIDSWALSMGIIVSDLKHSFQGLKSGLKIKSQTTGKEWMVKARLLFHHTIKGQRKFLSETTVLTHSSFGSVENMIRSSRMILEREKENIFQYQLQPIDHNSKPTPNDILLPAVE